MTTSAPQSPDRSAFEQLVATGNLAAMNNEQRTAYYNAVCESLGMNPLTQPFAFITLNGKLQLYARKDAADQLRKIYGVSVVNLTHDYRKELELYIVTASGQLPTGRQDTGTGAVTVKGVSGEALANAIMKAETKAKRRLTLSICGLGILDETEIESTREVINTTGQDPTAALQAPKPIEVPKVDHTPAEGKDVGRPGEKKTSKKGSPKKDVVAQPAEQTQQAQSPEVAPPTEAQVGEVAGSSPAPSTNIHGVNITDDDLPENLQPEKKETPDRAITAEEKTAFAAKLRTYKCDGEALKKYIRGRSGKEKLSDITYLTWKAIFEKLDSALNEKDLTEIITAK